jgi:aerobic-type carbon monoxide dehydrogenase small subunit (CoxS/CutS family)
MRPHNQSRRSFIKGIIASGAVASGGGMLFLAGCSDDSQTATAVATPGSGAVERLVSLDVNGTIRRVDVLPNETLAQTLRNKLDLTGTKLACDRGECGACTVLIDGVPHNSCSMLTHTVRAARVQTIEGVANADGSLHPLQTAMIEELGPQCGFCTPGQIMSGLALLAANPNPTRDQARAALAGNLCRCGAYDQYLNAVLRAAQEMA